MNGDGFAEVIVGAHHYSNGQFFEGRAFVYHGATSGLPANPSWTAESDQALAKFGNSVGMAGDVNGDGSADVIVGAYDFTNGQSFEGRAFVYHGPALAAFHPTRIAIDDRAVEEGGVANASFRVTLDPPSTETVTVEYATSGGTATAPSDYAHTSGTLTFSPGRTTHSISIPIVTDSVPEPSEHFFVSLSNPTNAGIRRLRAQGWIGDPPTPANVRMYRAYNPNAHYHFFTTAYPEFANAVSAGYRDETTGLTGFCVANTARPGTTTIFRMYNPNSGRHYYSVGPGERDELKTIGWVYEKDEGFIFTAPGSGLTEIFKLYNKDSGVHLYTESATTKDAILADFSGIWFQHTSLGYGFASPQDGSCP